MQKLGSEQQNYQIGKSATKEIRGVIRQGGGLLYKAVSTVELGQYLSGQGQYINEQHFEPARHHPSKHVFASEHLWIFPSARAMLSFAQKLRFAHPTPQPLCDHYLEI